MARLERHGAPLPARLTDPHARRPGPAGGHTGGTTWGLDPEPARRVLAALGRGATPAGPGVDGPWAAFTVRGDGAVVAAVSYTLASGLFWTVDDEPGAGRRLLAGVHLGEVVRARRGRTHLDARTIDDLTRGRPPAEATPYREVRRIRPGGVVIWERPGAGPRELPGTGGPDDWPAPSVEGPDVPGRYLATFDRVLDDLVVDGEPLCATLSGGLDSSFVVASLVRHATPDRPVHAFVHSPHPGARLQPNGNWDPDDFEPASEMAEAYPGLVRLVRVVNEDLRQPLDVALGVAERTWAPVTNVDNGVWLEDMRARAAALGASRLLIGENGNAAFSHGHGYAAAHYLRRGDVPALARLVTAEHAAGRSWPDAVARRIAGQLLLPVRQRWAQGRSRPPHPLAAFGVRPPPDARRPPRVDRAAYLTWLRAGSSRAAFLQPATGLASLVDPFAAGPVLDLAAAMTPLEWSRGGLHRGYARLLGAGRVPDAIRLRTRRGGQSWDAWYVVAGQRDRYLDEVAAVASTPVMADLVDVDVLRASVAAWPWGRPGAPMPAGVTPLNRLLATAAFVRLTDRRLRALDAGGPGPMPGGAPA